MLDSLRLINYGDGYKIIHCRYESNGRDKHDSIISPLGFETFTQGEGLTIENYGVTVSDKALEQLYNQLKGLFDKTTEPTASHHKDMRDMAFGLLKVLQK